MQRLAAVGPSLRRFRINDFPERDRLEAWREIFGRAFMRVEIEPMPGRQYFGDITLRRLPDLGMGNGITTGMQYRRSQTLIDNDDLVLHISLSGGFCGHQRDVRLDKGQAVLMSSEQTGLVSHIEESFLVFRVPLRVMSPIVADLDPVLYRPIPQGTEALGLLVNYAGAICQMPTPGKPDVRHLAAAHTRDLIALAVGATRDAAEIANGRGVRAARMHAIKVDIAEH